MDVKRGVYIGECSQLAVLCSSKENYIAAIKDLNTLYLIRGYPLQLVMSWCKKNIQERWDKRFALQTQREHDDNVLVLKSRFNDIWNWFSAAELGKAVSGYWEEWYNRASDGRYIADLSRPFLPYDPQGSDDLAEFHPGTLTCFKDRLGEDVWVPDLRKIGLLGCRWIVSRKRTTNLLDLSQVWKKTVFRKLDEAIADEGGVLPENSNNIESVELPGLNLQEPVTYIHSHFRSVSPESYHPEFGRISKTHNRWGNKFYVRT